MVLKKILLLLIALVIAGGTVVVARGMLSKNSGGNVVEKAAPAVQEVLVAAHDMPAGTMIKDVDLKWQPWPKGEKEDTAGLAVKGRIELKEYVGQVVRYGMRAGEPLMAGRTVRPGEQGFMAAALAPGMRAVSIAITPVAGVAGFVFPGDRVDVIVTHTIGRKNDAGGEERRVSETMVKNVRVLALDQKMNDQVTEPKVAQVATLEVTSKQAETMALVSQIGTVSLALRSIANDPEEEKPQAAVPPDIALDAAELTVPPALPPASDTLTWDSDVSKVLPQPTNRLGATQRIQIIRGHETTESVFDMPQQ